MPMYLTSVAPRFVKLLQQPRVTMFLYHRLRETVICTCEILFGGIHKIKDRKPRSTHHYSLLGSRQAGLIETI